METFVLQNPLPPKLEGVFVDISSKESLAKIAEACETHGYFHSIEIQSSFQFPKIKIYKGKEVHYAENLEAYLVVMQGKLRILSKSFIETNYRKI
jgi:hypothetical protein